jgi:hypothetical protein
MPLLHSMVNLQIQQGLCYNVAIVMRVERMYSSWTNCPKFTVETRAFYRYSLRLRYTVSWCV